MFFFFFSKHTQGKRAREKNIKMVPAFTFGWLHDPFSISASFLPLWNDHILLSQRDRPSWRAEKGSRVSILSSGLSPSRFHLSLPALCRPRLSGSSALDGVRCPGSAGVVSTRDRAQRAAPQLGAPRAGSLGFPSLSSCSPDEMLRQHLSERTKWERAAP